LADPFPVPGGRRPVLAGGAEVDLVLVAVVVEPELADDDALDLAVGVAHRLEVVLFVGPAAGDDGMAVDDLQRVVVLAGGVLAPGQGPPAAVGGPRRGRPVVLPAAGTAVARRVADLVHALGPGPAGPVGGDVAHVPGLVGAELEPLRRLPGPVLPPVLGDVAGRRMDQQVLQHDPAGGILDHEDDLAATAAHGARVSVAGLVD